MVNTPDSLMAEDAEFLPKGDGTPSGCLVWVADLWQSMAS
jgi:hypothetical protein